MAFSLFWSKNPLPLTTFSPLLFPPSGSTVRRRRTRTRAPPLPVPLPPSNLPSPSAQPHTSLHAVPQARHVRLPSAVAVLRGAMWPLWKAVAWGVGGLSAAGIGLLVAFQEKLIYVPALPGIPRSYPITPERLRLDYEDVWLRSSDGVRLHAWLVRNPQPPRSGPTILFFQGNGGNIAHRLQFVNMILQQLHCNVFLLSYRGYGESDGSPSEHGINKDAQAALDHLSQRRDIDTSRIVVFGRSLGGAVGTILAKNNPDKVSALILENTFTSILDMASVVLPFLGWFIGGSTKNPKVLNFLVRSPWRTHDIIHEVKQPILFLSGSQDELVPPHHMRMLHSKAADHNDRCHFADFPSGMHMDTWVSGGDRYWRIIELFLDQHAPAKQRDDLESEQDDGR